MKGNVYFAILLMCLSVSQGKFLMTTEQLIDYCSKYFNNTTEDPNWNKCLWENKWPQLTLKQLGPNNKIAFKDNKCFCDGKCSEYGDCCPDISASSNHSWTCRPWNFISGMYVYMIQGCPVDWRNNLVRELCEDEASLLAARGRHYHHLQDIPVYSSKSKIIYKNVFCAKCNRDMNIHKWNVSFSCDRSVNESVLSKAVYLPIENEWKINLKNGTDDAVIKCIIDIPELEDWNNVINLYNGRRCLGISSCSSRWRIPDVIKKCNEFTDVQYVYYSNVGIRYKNPYCAICNYLNIDEVKCIQSSSAPEVFGTETWKPLYPSLIDFNFDGDSDSHCSSQQLYDPILKMCFNLSCIESSNDSQCLDKTNGTNNLRKICTTIVFDRDSFILLDNDTIFVNYTKKNYTSKQYDPIFINGELSRVLICAEEVISFNFTLVQYWMSEIGLLISIVCLLIHLTIYFLLPKLHNLPGKILICLSLSLLIAQTSFLLGAYDSQVSSWHCKLLGIVTHFSYLAAFFWMNIMAFDIYRTFCKSRPRSIHSQTFIKYSTYCWISPLLIITASLIMNFVYPQSLYSPNYGRHACWISQRRGLFIFFGLPLLILLTANIILFLLTAGSLIKTARETKIASKFSDKVRFFLYIKIALMLGLTWIFGFLATLINISALWYPFIIFNSLQGAFIFLSFTMKKKVLFYLKERFLGEKYKKKNQTGQMKKCTSSSNLSTIQTSLTTSLSASVSVLCNQTEIIKAMINGKPQNVK